MGARIEIQTQTIHFPHHQSGRHIIESAQTCAREGGVPLVETVTQAPSVSGEEDFRVWVKGKLPDAMIEVFSPLSSCKGFIESYPSYEMLIIRLVAKPPISTHRASPKYIAFLN